MVVGEKEVINLGGKQAGLDQLVGGGRAAIEHQQLAGHAQHVSAAKPGCRWGRRARSQHVNFRHTFALRVD